MRSIFILATLLWLSLPGISQNLLQSTDFLQPNIAPWKLYSVKDAPPTGKRISEGALIIEARGASDKPMARALSQDVTLKDNGKFTLSFEVRGELTSGMTMVVMLKAPGGGEGNDGLSRKIDITEDWQKHELKFVARMANADGASMLKFLMGTLEGEISLRNITLVER